MAGAAGCADRRHLRPLLIADFVYWSSSHCARRRSRSLRCGDSGSTSRTRGTCSPVWASRRHRPGGLCRRRGARLALCARCSSASHRRGRLDACRVRRACRCFFFRSSRPVWALDCATRPSSRWSVTGVERRAGTIQGAAGALESLGVRSARCGARSASAFGEEARMRPRRSRFLPRRSSC